MKLAKVLFVVQWSVRSIIFVLSVALLIGCRETDQTGRSAT